jgi:hypothetical protein
MRQISLGINQSFSNRLRVQIIPQLYIMFSLANIIRFSAMKEQVFFLQSYLILALFNYPAGLWIAQNELIRSYYQTCLRGDVMVVR